MGDLCVGIVEKGPREANILAQGRLAMLAFGLAALVLGGSVVLLAQNPLIV